MADRTSVDVETAPRIQIAKKSMWQSIAENPKVLFIAFFASFVYHIPENIRQLTISGSAVSNMATNKVSWANL